MKQVLKKIGYVLLVMSLVLAYVPAVASAMPIHIGRYTPLEKTTVIFPNPRDENQQIRTIRSASDALDMMPFGAEEEYLSDIQAAAALVREGMKKRENVITVLYRAPVSQDFSTEIVTPIWDGARAHTGNPIEGDYLQWQWESFGVSGGGYTDGVNNYHTLQFEISYYTTLEQENWMDSSTAELLGKLNLDGKTDYEVLCAVYDWMSANITYDYDHLDIESYKLKYTAYAALHDKTSVCQGYALLLYRLMLELGIDCRVITGLGNGGGHAWNIVELDGKYYNVDATWDASRHQVGLEYEYFLRADATFADHIRDEEYATEAFTAAYPMGTADYTPYAAIASGTCGDALTWVLTDNGTLTILGSGAMYDYIGYMPINNSTTPWDAYADKITSVVIENGVTYIGQCAFFGLDKLTTVKIGSDVESIGNIAFGYCTSLQTVTVPENVITIGGGAFRNCVALTNISLSAGLVHIGDNAFAQCTSLTQITLPDSVETIGAYAFAECTQLTDFSIGKGVSVIGEYAFDGCTMLGSIEIPDAVTTIGSYAFRGCSSLAEVTMGAGVTSIGDYAFSNCTSLMEIEIPDQVTNLGTYAFAQCTGLLKVSLGHGLTAIGDSAFRDCTALVSISIPGNVKTVGAYAFADCTALSEVSIADGVTIISDYGFTGCTALHQVALPNSVTDLGEGAYHGCAGLVGLDLGNGLTTIGTYAFFGCSSLTDVTVPDSVTTIGYAAFTGCNALESMTLPFVGGGNQTDGYLGHLFGATVMYEHGHLVPSSLKTVILSNACTKIPTSAFEDCVNLLHIVISDHVTQIGESAFRGCVGLEEIWIPASVTDMAGSAFADCTGLQKLNVAPENEVYHDAGNCIIETASKKLVVGCKTSVIPDDGSVTKIGDSAFEGCADLTNITLPGSLKEIGASAFRECVGLMTIVIPDGVYKVGYGAFFGCAALEEIILPDSLNYIEGAAFYDCVSLTNIELPFYLYEIGGRAFTNCTSLVSVTMGPCVYWIQEEAFAGCTNLTAVKIGTCTPEFGYRVFDGCENLWHILYGFSEETWNELNIHPDNENLFNTIVHFHCVGDEIVDLDGKICTLCCTHHYEIVEKVPATCVDQGYTLSTCTICGHDLKSDYVEATGEHSYQIQVVEPTCQYSGYTRHTCSVCADTFDDNYVDPIAHDDQMIEKVDPTCNGWGYVVYTCARCGYTHREDLEPTGHLNTHLENQKDPTCGEGGYTGDWVCDTCGKIVEYGSYMSPTYEHNFAAEVIIPAGCEYAGEALYTCSGCGDYFYQSIAPTGHQSTHIENQKDATCGVDGYSGDTVCDACGQVLEYGYSIGATGQHDYTSWVTKEPGCETMGVMTYSCSVCNHTYEEQIPAAGHGSTHIENQKAPGCLEEGYSGDTVCDVCGQIIEYGTVIPAAGEHRYMSREILAPGCDYPGEVEYECLDCHHIYYDKIPAIGHNYATVNRAEPTCGMDGYTGDTICTNCGQVSAYGQPIPATGLHTYITEVVAEPTCEAVGLKNHVCTGCGDSYTEEIPPTGHDYTVMTVAPTCTSQGYTEYSCNVCGYSYITDYTEMVEHNYMVETVLPTCTDNGYSLYTCLNCGESYREDIAATGHQHTSVVNQKDATCGVDGYTGDTVCDDCGQMISMGEWIPQTGEHSFGQWEIIVEPTDFTTGLASRQCQVCGITQTEVVPALEHTTHDYTYYVETAQPTCTQDGYTLYSCRCGDSYTEIIPALGHTEVILPGYPASCTWDGMTDSSYCDVCHLPLMQGVVIPATGHSYEAEVTTQPGCVTDGVRTYTCANCGDAYVEAIPAVGHNYTSVVTAPTCTEKGYTTHSCVNCGATYTSDQTDALGHSYEAVVTAPTCTQQGFTTHTCTVCADSYVDSYTDAVGHTWDAGVVTTEPTVDAEGVRTYTCVNCGETRTEVIEKLPGVVYDVPEDDSVTIHENDCFEGGTTVTVEQKEEGDIFDQATGAMQGREESFVVFEFTAFKDGAAVQPNDKLMVIFAIPENYSTNVVVYYMDEAGKLEQLQATVDADARTVTVELSHFSTYILADNDTAPQVLIGDVNGDGRVNARDARELLRWMAGLTEDGEFVEAAADVNGDGRINARDARELLRQIAGL